MVRAAWEHPARGTRRTAPLVRRQKPAVHRKRVQRVMREENRLRRRRSALPLRRSTRSSVERGNRRADTPKLR